jgi:hypothetical protein
MKCKLAAACIVSVLSLAPQAFAGTMTLSYQGVVDNTQILNGHMESAPDNDVADLFGGGNLEGEYIYATYVYNTSNGIERQTAGSAELDGGSGFFASDPLTSVTITIQLESLKTYSYTYTPDYYAQVYTGADVYNSSGVETGVSGLDEIGDSSVGDQSFTYMETNTAAPASLSSSYFGYGYGPGSYFDPGLTNTKEFDAIVFDTSLVAVSYAPEPSTWALMFTGVGLVGGAMRFSRRRRDPSMTAA